MNDWRESELEDYLAANHECLRQAMFAHHTDNKELVYLGRQIRCNVGIIDLMFHSWLTLYVVELKAVKATSKDLGQVIRYSRYVSENLGGIVSLPRPTSFNGALYQFVHDGFIEIEPVLIAPSFESSATTMTGVRTLRATKTVHGFDIQPHGDFTPSFDDARLHEVLAPFAALVQEECRNKLEFDAKQIAELSARQRLTEVN